MGSIRERSKCLYFDFRFKGVRCREYTKVPDNPGNRKRFKQVMDRIEAEITLGTFEYAKYFPNSPLVAKFKEHGERLNEVLREEGRALPTFEAFAGDWFEEMKIQWRTSYIQSTEITLRRYLLPHFGKKEVGAITKTDILAFRSSLAKVTVRNTGKGLSASRVNHIMMPLRMILNEAANRFNFSSPYQGIKSLKVPRTDVEPFTLEEVGLILDNVRADFRNYYTVRFFTGLRTAEVDGLQWQYVDFERGLIMVRQAIVQNEIVYTKNDGSFRDVQLSPPVIEALESQKGMTGHQQFVFCKSGGDPLQHNNVTRKVWYPLLRYLGLRKRRPYQTRHTAATLWLAAGESPEWIARQMGHSTTEMLFKVYSRFVPNLTRRDGSAFDSLLEKQYGSSRPVGSRSPLVLRESSNEEA